MMKLISGLILCLGLVSSISQASTERNCTSAYGLGEIPNGSSASGYTSPVSTPGFPCTLTTVMCLDGRLTGPDLYPTCENVPQDCQGIPNGGSVTGYQSPSGPCAPLTVTCTNGSLSGPMPFPFCYE